MRRPYRAFYARLWSESRRQVSSPSAQSTSHRRSIMATCRDLQIFRVTFYVTTRDLLEIRQPRFFTQKQSVRWPSRPYTGDRLSRNGSSCKGSSLTGNGQCFFRQWSSTVPYIAELSISLRKAFRSPSIPYPPRNFVEGNFTWMSMYDSIDLFLLSNGNYNFINILLKFSEIFEKFTIE